MNVTSFLNLELPHLIYPVFCIAVTSTDFFSLYFAKTEILL